VKLSILSAVHGIKSQRGDIYKFFLRRMAHLKDKYGIETLVVGSERRFSYEPTNEAGLIYLQQPNNPVSDKWNAGLQALREQEPTHVMVMGSDDLVSDSLIERYLDIIKEDKYGMFGITDSYYTSLKPDGEWFNKCYYWPGYEPIKFIIGYAKVYSDFVLHKVKWRLWPTGIDSRLDGGANDVIEESGLTCRRKQISIKEEGHLHIDIKTEMNISSLSPIARDGREVDLDELLRRHLPPWEAEDIISYRDTVAYVANEIR